MPRLALTVSVVAAAFAAGLACEPIPELRSTAADASGGAPAPSSSSAGEPVGDPEAEIARILDGDDGGTGQSGGRDLYDRVCKRPKAESFCCGAVLCAGRARACEQACPACSTLCEGRLCCLLKRGLAHRCSDDKAECAAALRAGRADANGPEASGEGDAGPEAGADAGSQRPSRTDARGK